MLAAMKKNGCHYKKMDSLLFSALFLLGRQSLMWIHPAVGSGPQNGQIAHSKGQIANFGVKEVATSFLIARYNQTRHLDPNRIGKPRVIRNEELL
jgi:hypothetical protein